MCPGKPESIKSLKFFSFFLLFLAALPATAQDSVKRIPIGQGLIFSHYSLPGPLSVDVLRIDLSSPELRIESYRPHGLVPVSAQVRGRESDGKSVLGAVNGDFFSFKTLRPIGNQVVNGVFVNGVQSRRSHLGIVGRVHPFILPLSFQGSAVLHGRSHALAAINQPRNAREIVLYNSYWGSVTPSDSAGAKIALRLLGSRWCVADTIVTVVRQITDSASVCILADEAVLICGSQAGAGIGDCVAGDTVRLVLGFSGLAIPFTQVVGGAGRILKDGRSVAWQDTVAEGLRTAFLTDRHPRTFVGVNRDTTVMLLCTVDGRQRLSVGMGFGEMADFLKKVGALDAINLDGGGSTTMVLQGRTVNVPSDSTGERGVANSIMILRDAGIGK